MSLISAEALAGRKARLFDCRHDLADPGYGDAAYAVGHIPGALRADLDRDLSGPKTGRNGRHPLPSRDAFAHWLGSTGLRPSDEVVAYDDAGGIFAARLWWLLRWMGHEKIAILDGGYAAWTSAGYAIESDTPSFAESVYPVLPASMPIVTADDVLASLETSELLLVDARSAERFAGQGETIDPVAGHIPGALNRHFARNLGPDGRFKPANALRAEFAELLHGRPTADLVHQCGSGVTACHNLFAMELAGLGGSRLYPGSWSEWCADAGRPVAVGKA